ncbi:MAG: HlyD family efflux transporter periplasmic adaptor subunit [Betaproteobacteria bacterium]|nr:HlyD family efflux transporter periplasmic adaptor subunit [Betaproteobacteria bacterium]MBV9359931.1 HlyD family efflux transporter periplasmic adaptor subunit [Betaproteobacteria bacterium]
MLLALALFAGCQKQEDGVWQGYVEGEYVLLASPYAGQLQKLFVRRGDQIEAGNPVFVLEQEAERQARAEAEERVKSAQAKLENLQVPLREPQIQALRESLNQAKAAKELSRVNLTREEDLMKKGYTTKPRLDEARSNYVRDTARVKEAEEQLKNAQMPLGRQGELEGAQAEMAAAKAALAQADWRLEQKSVAAPVSGLVQDTFFVIGEWVGAGKPVASLLPPGNVKARFYVPETVLSSISIGRPIEIRCDGCQPIDAKVSYVSSQAEYTPPVLYSKESRSKLLFLVEARLPNSTLRPGQPLDVRLK